MLKKILLGAAMLATSSFATFSAFPVPDAHKGDVKLVSDFTIQDKAKSWELSLKGRFVPVQNLELWLGLPYMLMTSWDGHDSNGDGMKNLTFGGRYQITPNVAGFLDLTFPTGKKAINDDGLGFNVGAQFSKNFGSIDFGSELGLMFNTEGDDKYKSPMQLHINAEVDPIVSQTVSPYIGADFYIALGDPKFDGHKSGNTSGDIGIFPYLGANFKFTEMFSADLCAIFGFGSKSYAGDKTPITLEASFNATF
jgi:hypothetical protein